MSRTTVSVGLGPDSRLEAGVPLRPAVPLRINLLPHREMRRERRKKDFVLRSVLVGIAGLVAVAAGGMAINQRISAQQERNDFIRAENARLDKQIAEIKTIREEIARLNARQEAVERLQRDRTTPVRLFDELVRLTPDGLSLRQFKHEDSRISLTGHAQTNERVAELLRNLAERSPWLERPELGEIREVTLPPTTGQKEGRKVFEFSLNALIRRPADPSTPGTRAAPVAAATPR